jgi:hypothetical protein
MKILLNVCTPRQVREAFPTHAVYTAAKLGWRELENGDLLRVAEENGFELFVICDKNMRCQQNLSARRIAILELWTNHRPTLEQNWEYIRVAGESLAVGDYKELKAPL